MATTHLKRITNAAKALRRSKPNMKWTDAIKQASKSMGKARSKPAPKKRAKKSTPRKKAAVKRVSRPRAKTTTRVRSTSVKTVGLAGVKKVFLAEKEIKLGKLVVKHMKAKKVGEKRKIAKEIMGLKRQICSVNKM